MLCTFSIEVRRGDTIIDTVGPFETVQAAHRYTVDLIIDAGDTWKIVVNLLHE